jgi:hypothetical protein
VVIVAPPSREQPMRPPRRCRRSDAHALERTRATAIIVAIVLAVLCGFVAMSLDVGHLFSVRGELQNGADAAAMAGAKRLNGTNLTPSSRRRGRRRRTTHATTRPTCTTSSRRRSSSGRGSNLPGRQWSAFRAAGGVQLLPDLGQHRAGCCECERSAGRDEANGIARRNRWRRGAARVRIVRREEPARGERGGYRGDGGALRSGEPGPSYRDPSGMPLRQWRAPLRRRWDRRSLLHWVQSCAPRLGRPHQPQQQHPRKRQRSLQDPSASG